MKNFRMLCEKEFFSLEHLLVSFLNCRTMRENHLCIVEPKELLGKNNNDKGSVISLILMRFLSSFLFLFFFSAFFLTI